MSYHTCTQAAFEFTVAVMVLSLTLVTKSLLGAASNTIERMMNAGQQDSSQLLDRSLQLIQNSREVRYHALLLLTTAFQIHFLSVFFLYHPF